MYLAIRRTIGRKLCCWKVFSCAGRIAVFRTWWNDLLTTPDIHKFVLKRCHVSSAAIAFAFVVLKKMRHCPSLFAYLDYSIDRRLYHGSRSLMLQQRFVDCQILCQVHVQTFTLMLIALFHREHWNWRVDVHSTCKRRMLYAGP